MNRLLFFIFLCIVSCDYFENKKVSVDAIVKKELETIDWNSVDEYPSFTICDSVIEKIPRKNCFESTILSHVNSNLSEQTIVVSEDVNDTIKMNLQIDKSGNIKVLDIIAKSETLLIVPKIDSLLTQSISTLPKIFPALKRGQQVTTELVLPVIVSIK